MPTFTQRVEYDKQAHCLLPELAAQLDHAHSHRRHDGLHDFHFRRSNFRVFAVRVGGPNESHDSRLVLGETYGHKGKGSRYIRISSD